MKIEMLPAAFGDCLLVEYGGRRASRVLIDGGLVKTYKEALAPRLRELDLPVELELLVVTHIDRDHICGILPLLRGRPPLVAAADIWFNGHGHLTDVLGPADGEALGALLDEARLPWNQHEAFGRGPIVVPDRGPLPVATLPGGAKLTLLSPSRERLRTLLANWSDELGAWGDDVVDGVEPGEPDDILGKRPPLPSVSVDDVEALARDEFREDTAPPNGSSIAFLFEHGGERVLFGADAYPSELLQALERYAPGRRVELSAFKLAHHGSRANLSTELLEKIDCSRYLVSSNGGTYGHPDPEAIARILEHGGERKTLYFNYASDYTTIWDDAALMRRYGYDVRYPASAGASLVIDL